MSHSADLDRGYGLSTEDVSVWRAVGRFQDHADAVDMLGTLRGNVPELIHRGPIGVHRLGPLTHEALTCSIQDSSALLSLALGDSRSVPNAASLYIIRLNTPISPKRTP